MGVLPVDGARALAQGSADHGGTLRAMVANSIDRTSRARCMQPKVGEFRDTFPKSGSAFAVLRCAALRLSVPNRSIFVFVVPRHPGKFRVADGGVCLNFSFNIQV